MVKANTLTQNTTYYTVALVLQKVIAFVYFTLLARSLGVEDLGKYSFAFSFTTIFSVLVDLGMSSILTREIAKDRARAQSILSNVIGLKLVMSVLIYVLVVVMVNILGYSAIVKNLVYITGLIMLLDNFSTSFWATLRGNQNLKYESIGIVIFEILLCSLGLIFLYNGMGVAWVVVATLIGSFFFVCFSFYHAHRRLGLEFKAVWDSKILKTLFKISWPFALMGIFARLNTQIDTVFLSKIGCAGEMCDTNVGIYSIATKITLAVHFIPLAFTAALFPALSEYFISNKEKFARIFEKSMRYMMIVGVPLSLGIYSLAPTFVPQVFGSEYVGSITPLRILIVSLIFMFLTFPIGSLLNAASRQLRNSMQVGVAVLVNIILNLILIPKMLYNGAAWASFASTVVMLALGLQTAPKIVQFSKRPLVLSFMRTLFSGIVMAFVLGALLNRVHFIFLIPVGVIMYFIILFFSGEMKRNDINEILISLKIKK
ncbi:MAG: flippase [Patescibacteria group bacterium]